MKQTIGSERKHECLFSSSPNKALNTFGIEVNISLKCIKIKRALKQYLSFALGIIINKMICIAQTIFGRYSGFPEVLFMHLTLKRQTKIAADDIIIFYFYLSKKIRLD